MKMPPRAYEIKLKFFNLVFKSPTHFSHIAHGRQKCTLGTEGHSQVLPLMLMGQVICPLSATGFSALTLEFGALAPKKIGFTGGSDGKESACNSGDLGSILG